MPRVIVVNDQLGTRDFAQPLREAGDIKVVATFSGIAAALRLLSSRLPGVDLLVTYTPAGPEDLIPLRAIIQLFRDAGIGTLVLADHTDRAFVEELVRVGARGCLPAHSDAESIIRALRLVADPSYPLDPGLIQKVAEERVDAVPRS